MKILITGITGFIGHHLAERLIDDGHDVFALVRTTSRISELSQKLQSNVQFLTYDNNNTIKSIITKLCSEEQQIDVVYHLATKFINVHQFDDIKSIIQSNITFGTELLDALTANNIRNFINTGTFTQHYNDEHYNPFNLYSASKKCFEDVIKFYCEVHDLKCISLHLFDTYGSDDKRGKILGLLKKISQSGETLKMSPGEQLIDIVYIDDVINAFTLAGIYLFEQKYDYCGTYGVSSMNPVSLREVVKVFETVLGKKLSIEWGGLPYRQREMMVPWKSFKVLPNWTPKTKLDEGIKKFLLLE